jgi:hypothetical protein
MSRGCCASFTLPVPMAPMTRSSVFQSTNGTSKFEEVFFFLKGKKSSLFDFKSMFRFPPGRQTPT